MRDLRDRSVGRVDDADLARLCDEHASALLAYAGHLTRDRQLAEDIVQETLLRAWTHPAALSGERGSPRAWLLTVARNVAMDQFRARRARPSEVTDDLIDASGLTSDDDTDLAVQALVVAEGLAALSPEHRAVLVEMFYVGRSVAQAAAVLGVPMGTVKSRTYYALRALKAALVERGVTS